jgi:chemotaxis family two-component system sensor histidine kinase/response regulator PixL
MTISKTILVVDDNVINRLLPGLILRPFGWHVYESENGVDALEQLQKHQISCVLLDISMPDISGLEVLSDLRKNKAFAALKIVAYTAYATQADVAHLTSIGFDAVLIKPLTSRTLLDVLNFY